MSHNNNQQHLFLTPEEGERSWEISSHNAPTQQNKKQGTWGKKEQNRIYGVKLMVPIIIIIINPETKPQ